MPLNLSPTFINEINNANTSAIDLFEVDFGFGVKRFWSTHLVPSDFLFQDFNVSSFEPRIISVGNRTWRLGPDDDTLTLTLAENVGDFFDTTKKHERISDITKQYGIDVFEGANVRAHRLFPKIKSTFKNYWFGKGLALELGETQHSWEISFGFGNFRRRFGRRVQVSCPFIFSGGPASDCPYNPFVQIGIPQAQISRIAGAGTSNTTINAFSGLSSTQVGWLVFNRTTNSFATINKIISDSSLTITNVKAGESGSGTFSQGDQLIFGPPFVECPKTVAACKERGMFGKHNKETFENGVGDNRRYFGGTSVPARVEFVGRTPKSEGGDRFKRNTQGNESDEDTVIPVIFGFMRVINRPSMYFAPAGDFQHGLFVHCEGEIFDVRQPVVNDKPPDNNKPKDLDTTNEIIQNDSFIKFGMWASNLKSQIGGIEDFRAVDIDSAVKVRRGIGRRKSFATNSLKELDTYGNGLGGVSGFGNPFLFNDGFGDGISFHGLAMSRIRIETQEDIKDALSGEFDINGLLVQIPSSLNNNSEDGTRFNLQTLKYTRFPNPIQVAFQVAIDPRWGGGISTDRIDETSVKRESDFCEEFITSVQGTAEADMITTVQFSSVAPPEMKIICTAPEDFVFVDIQPIYLPALIGSSIYFHAESDTVVAILTNARRILALTQEARMEQFRHALPNCAIDISGIGDGTLISVDRSLPSTIGPGTRAEIKTLNSNRTKRYKANGVLADDISVGEMLELVLKNCFGTFRITGDKLEFVIRKKLNASELQLISQDIFTDRGSSPNIIRDENGVSTVKVTRNSITEIPNEYSVEFLDIQRDFKRSRVIVFSERAQIRAAEKLGEKGDRKVIKKKISLNLTTRVDQAARLLTLFAREMFVENLFISFQTSLKNGFAILPGDVIAVDSNVIASHISLSLLPRDVSFGGALFFRVLEKNEDDKFVISFMCQIHVNSIFDSRGGSADDLGVLFDTPTLQEERGGLPLPVVPLVAVEKSVIQNDGSVRNFIQVKATFP